jgi:hypothetical protein
MKEDLPGYRDKLLKELADIESQMEKHGLLTQTVEIVIPEPVVEVTITETVVEEPKEEPKKEIKRRGRPVGWRKPVKKVTKKK